MEDIKLLKKKFIGRGEVKGFQFTQIYAHDLFYVYQVNCDPSESNHTYYELIKRYSMWGRECYPGSNTFGRYGWTHQTLEGISELIMEHFNIDITFQYLIVN